MHTLLGFEDISEELDTVAGYQNASKLVLNSVWYVKFCL